ncbi:MAG: hypothetical protein EPN22_15050 [Nitrospirae bacterium]|nr:MAG: hypothetical protein EPN22_15050 [Nitrospirota bacterium]
MITTEQARTLALASQAASDASDGKIPQLEGYTALTTPDLNHPDTGLSLTIFQKNGTTGEFIVAFAGTGNAQDFAADLALGTPQWKAKGKDIIDYLNNTLHATNVDFTGRSLGGALAQYAAYDYLATTQNPAVVSLTTYNGLGGIAGLKQMHPNDSDSTIASIAAQLDAAHFYTKSANGVSDIVSRLGEGHFGGSTYEIPMSTDANCIGVHLAWDKFNDLTEIPQSSTPIEYLNVPWAQKIAALAAFFGDDGKFNNTEGFFRVAGGALLSLNAAPANQVDQLIDAMFPGAAFIDWGLARDLMPSQMRLATAMLGMELIGGATSVQLGGYTSEWTTVNFRIIVPRKA